MYKRIGFTHFFSEYPIVFYIFIFNLLFFLLTTVPIFPSRVIFETMAGVNILIANGEWWRMITPIFIHSGLSHFLFNSFALFIFGSILEKMVSKTRFILLYLSSGIFANVVTFIFASLTLVHVGSSGALFGILGVFSVFIFYKKFSNEQSKSFGFLILFAIIFTFIQKDINIYAHLGGFIWGLFCGYIFMRKQ